MPFGGRNFHPPGGYKNFSFAESELMIPELERDTSHIVRATRDANTIMAGLVTQVHSMTKATEEEEEEEEEMEDDGVSAFQDRLHATEDEEEEEMEEDGVSAFQDRLNATAEEEEEEEEENEEMEEDGVSAFQDRLHATEEVEEDGVSAFQDRLNAIEEVILRWEEDQSMVWDSEPEEASDYLNADENEEMEEDGVNAFQDRLNAIDEEEEDGVSAFQDRLHATEEEEEEEENEEEEEEEEEEEVEEDGVSAFQDRLNAIEEVILRWEEDQSMVWDSEPEEASDYLNAANEARRLIEKLEALHLSKEDQEYKFLDRAYNILQTAMARLEEEFRNLLIQDRRPFEYVSSSSRSNEEEYTADGSPAVSLGDNSVESLQREEEHILHLTNPDVIPDLRCIANLMFACNYGQECSRTYTIARRDALDESLFNLEMDRLSIENVLRMEWSTLNSKIKRWIWAVKIFVKVYLASEKWLSDQIFGEGEPISLVCFVDASKASILQLLDFAEAVSIGPHQPERLFTILDMYEALASLLQDIDALHSDDAGSCVRIQCHEVLKVLGDSVKATLLESEHTIASDVSQNPFVGGGIHARNVMNYVRSPTDYSETLNQLLKDKEVEDAVLRSPDINPNTEEGIKSPVSSAGSVSDMQ